MADLGTIGTLHGKSLRSPGEYVRCLRCNDEYQVRGQIDVGTGNPLPSLRMDAAGVWSCFVPVVSGDNTITVDVMQAANASPRPTMVLKANTEVGVNTDQTGTAGSGTGWVTITVPITATAEGVLQVELHNNLARQYGTAPCYWDNLNTYP